MWWLTWRQYRLQVIVTLALLAVMGVVLFLDSRATAGVVADNPGCPGGSSCGSVESLLRDRYQAVYAWLGWLPALPLLIGIFFGAPLLAREYERGTHRLAWTQSVSRARWLAVKLGGTALIVVLCGLAVGAMTTAWLATYDGSRLADEKFSNVGLFVVTGVVPGAWFFFLFATGVTAGALWRRVLPAVATTVAVFVVALFVLIHVRPTYAEPERIVLIDGGQQWTNDIVIADSEWQDPRGTVIGDGRSPMDVPECARLVDREAYWPCLYEAGYRQVVSYQPADRYWRFQWTEAGILVALAFALGAVTVAVTLRRRV